MKAPCTRIVVDTGIIVAFINKRDTFNEWVSDQLGMIEAPLYTCEAVITEACFLVQKINDGFKVIFDLMERNLIIIDFSLNKEVNTLKKLMLRYSNVPMSFADACLVRMLELHDKSKILTLDNDFNIYRKTNRHVIQTIMP